MPFICPKFRVEMKKVLPYTRENVGQKIFVSQPSSHSDSGQNLFRFYLSGVALLGGRGKRERVLERKRGEEAVEPFHLVLLYLKELCLFVECLDAE